MPVFVNIWDGKTIILEAYLWDNIGSLKIKIHDREGISFAENRLTFNSPGREIDDSYTLSRLGIRVVGI